MSDPQWKFARATVPQLEGHVLVLTDEDGHVGLGYAHAIAAISSHGEGVRSALQWLEPLVLGQRLDETAAIVDKVDASLAFAVTAKAAIDMALHDLLSRRLGVSLNVLFGGARRASIPQSRILAIKSPAEMAAKAAALGIPLIASRTSPTDMAIRICQEAGITLIGYLRGGRFKVYAHPELLLVEETL